MRIIGFSHYYYICVLLALSFSAYADPLILTDGDKEYDAYKYIEYYVDDEDAIKSPLSLESLGVLRPNESKTAIFGYQKGSLWLKLRVENKTDKRRFWSVYFTSLQLKELYFYKGVGDLAPSKGGYGVPMDQKTHKNFSTIMPFELEPGEGINLYFRTKSIRGLSHFVIAKPVLAQKKYMILIATRWGHLSILFLMLFITLVIYFYNRDTSYLFYSFFVLAMMVRMAIPSNLFNMVFGDLTGIDFQEYLSFAVLVPIFTACFFTVSFVKTKIYAPRFDMALKVFGALTMVLAILALGPLKHQIVPFQDILNGLSILVVIIAASICLSRGYTPARLFLIAWGGFVLGVIVWTLSRKNIFSHNYITTNGPILGNIFEMTFMSIALIDRSRFQKNLEQEKVKKEKESADLSRLLRVLVHDVCNPLAVVEGAARVGLLRCKDEGQAKIWQKVLKGTKTIVEITQDVKDYEAIRSGKAKMKLEPVNLAQIYKKAAFIFEDRLREKDLSFDYEAKNNEDIFVLAEPVSFSNNVMNNLISNAIKFSHRGGSIKVIAEGLSDKVKILISDTGIGMPEEIRRNIFNPAADTSRAGTQNEKGTGFGMPLVKTYVEHYGGSVSIWGEERVVEGTSVEVLLNRGFGEKANMAQKKD